MAASSAPLTMVRDGLRSLSFAGLLTMRPEGAGIEPRSGRRRCSHTLRSVPLPPAGTG